jgi:hypothetical protein
MRLPSHRVSQERIALAQHFRARSGVFRLIIENPAK